MPTSRGFRLRRPSAQIATVVSEVLSALSICAPVLCLDAPAAFAQPVAPANLVAEIPAQPLSQALAAFANQTGLQLVYVSGIVRSQRSQSVPAGLGAREALARLLQGTGLRFEYLTPQSIRILAVALPPQTTTKIPASGEAGEVIVTANRRAESLQDVPITIQVLTNATLAKLHATTFDDFVSSLPGVTARGVGPAQNDIYVRGLGVGGFGIQGAGFGASFPNVAVYLDEQSVELQGRNLDVYAADLERVELLEGPQGTLFGAGAEAGVLRYITNKPQLNMTEATVDGGYATTAHGAPSTALDAVVNIPIIANRLAARAVIYDEKRGGYIDNIPATFARSNNDVSIGYAGGKVPANSVVINNSAVVGDNTNPVTYGGARVEALYRFNDDWNALLAQSYQNMEADGVFTEEAANSLGQPQPDLTSQLFNPSYNKDRFENTALTVDGRVGPLKLLYAGSYLVRNIEQVQDYTNYARGGLYVDYYQCINPGPTPANAQCFSPSSTWRNVERNTHESQELRLSTPDGWRLRAVGGLFYENYVIQDQTDFFYLTALKYFEPIAPPTGYWAVNGSTILPDGAIACPCVPGAVLLPGGVTSNNPNVRPPGDAFFNDNTRGYKQRAAYTSVDFDIVPRALTLTAGTRYSSINSWEVGSYVSSFGCQLIYSPTAPDPCHGEFTNLNALGLKRTFSGFKSRANLSWRATEGALLYYTWSQGFRPGGFNRGFEPSEFSPLSPGQAPWQAQAYQHGGYVGPLSYEPDTLTNNELGWKTTWFDQRLQWNGALYQENWDNVQIGGIDNTVLGTGVFNAGNYRVRGVEMSAAARIASGLTVEVGAAWNQSELIARTPFLWVDGTPIDFDTLRTEGGEKLSNPVGALGSPLAGAPPFQGNIRMRYEVPINGYDAFFQVGAVHQAHSLVTTDRVSVDLQGNSVAYDLPPFTTYDAGLGMGKDGWLLELYGQNLTDTRAELYANYSQFYKGITVNRPRTIGLRFSYKFARG
jgi:outer membrane receptor protein involved in Fe transport